MRFHRKTTWAVGLILACAIVGGCGGRSGDGLSPSAAIIIDGSSTVFRISRAAQEGFVEVEPDVTVVVDNHGTGGGFGRYLEGEVDIIDASRDARPDEKEKAWSQGIEWTRFLVGYDGITLAVNSKNTFARSLTVEQLKKLWSAGSTVETWKELDASWPDRKIVLYSPDNDSGTYEFFVEAILGKGTLQRDDVQPSSDDNTLVNGVANDPDGLGYFGFAYYASNSDRLAALAVQNGPDAKPVAPNPETIADKSYAPLSRPLYIFVKNGAARRPEVAKFLEYYLDNVGEFAKKGGYDPPTPEDVEAGRSALARVAPRVEEGGVPKPTKTP